MRYADGFRRQCVERMLGEEQITTTGLACETGVSSTTLSRWRAEGRSVSEMKTPQRDDIPPAQRSAQEKLRLVTEASNLEDGDLGAFLRREGIHVADLDAWRQEFIALMNGTRSEKSSDQRRIRELERELGRKEKALAEYAALLVLQKKVQAIWGDEASDTPPKTDT